ncbi:DUF4188 domain-containing protein [Lichenihabitans sp. PAMC28606]|uniref:monooxygenase family protein n=1 Tax=Lichenihabitans TaxID=2723776 RepID=UPI00103834B1|nr:MULTISPECIES: DUF4188 domain-containing protein [Lichenihabitans]UDL95805.1 DUF4188 domain-containing protein [Lichenihabitans sp. PAMC28606]
MQGTNRKTVDLSAYPDLVMVLLGFRVNRLRSIPAFLRLGKGFAEIERDPPEGLLGEERCLYGWNHVGFRQYWRDLDCLERFTRSAPHSVWWREFLSDSHGAGFWHEAYSAKGGIEAIYIGMPKATGLAAFAPPRNPVGPFMSGRDRLRDDAAKRASAA